MKEKWLWLGGLGTLLALVPSVVVLTMMVISAEDSDFLSLFIRHIVVTSLALLVGYLCLRKGLEEQERVRVKALIREVLKEVEEKPPVTEKVVASKVVSLPFMKDENASN